MHGIPGRPVISNFGFYTDNISAFLDHQLKLIAVQVMSYIKDTKNFFKKTSHIHQKIVELILLK